MMGCPNRQLFAILAHGRTVQEAYEIVSLFGGGIQQGIRPDELILSIPAGMPEEPIVQTWGSSGLFHTLTCLENQPPRPNAPPFAGGSGTGATPPAPTDGGIGGREGPLTPIGSSSSLKWLLLGGVALWLITRN